MKYIIDKEDEGVRLDRYLRKKLKSTPLTEIFKAMRIGKIKVNNKKKKENYRLEEGDKVFIGLETDEEKNIQEEPFVKLSPAEKEELKKGIVFENDDLIIFNKKKDVVMHKGSGYEYGISEMFKSYFKNNSFNLIVKENSYNKPDSDRLLDAIVNMRDQMDAKMIKKLAIPKICCGRNGLEWDDVWSMFEFVFADSDVQILVCIQ